MAQMPAGITPSESAPESSGKRHGRRTSRFDDASLVIQAPFQASSVNCSMTGLGVETHESLPVGVTWPIRIRGGDRELVLEGSIRWARLSGTCRLENGDVAPIYRAGLVFMDGPSIETWRRAFSRALRRSGKPIQRPGRTVVKWKQARG